MYSLPTVVVIFIGMFNTNLIDVREQRLSAEEGRYLYTYISLFFLLQLM